MLCCSESVAHSHPESVLSPFPETAGLVTHTDCVRLVTHTTVHLIASV